MQRPALPDELRSTAEMLRRAYPNGVPSEELGVLAYFLCTIGEMSIRNVATVLGEINKVHYASLLHLVDKLVNGWGTIPEYDVHMACMRDKLRTHGVEEWLSEEAGP